MPPLMSASTATLNFFNWSATIRLMTVIDAEQFAVEPTARNSNLLPVKAKGEVRLRSVLSKRISGILPTTFSLSSVFFSGDILPLSNFSSSSKTSESCEPMNTEMMAGGASFAPKRWSFDAAAMAARMRSARSFTALMVLMKKVKNNKLRLGVLPGAKRLMPVLVLKLQLLCLPEPLMPAKGFSCRSTRKA